MKIIFDNDEEKEKFFKDAGAGCHDEFNSMNCNKYKSCSECWADNVPYEIKKPDMTFEEFNKAMLQDMHNFIKECEAKED